MPERLPPAQRAPALVFAACLLLVAGSAAVLFLLKLGAGPDAVREFYLGSEARFTAPRSLAGLLETALAHLVAMPLALFAAIHTVAWAGALAPRLLARLSAATFALALGGVAAGFAIRFAAPWLAWFKVVSFLGLEGLLVLWALLLAAVAWPPPRPAPRGARGEVPVSGSASGPA